VPLQLRSRMFSIAYLRTTTSVYLKIYGKYDIDKINELRKSRSWALGSIVAMIRQPIY
jgi:hypothetical protein